MLNIYSIITMNVWPRLPGTYFPMSPEFLQQLRVFLFIDSRASVRYPSYGQVSSTINTVTSEVSSMVPQVSTNPHACIEMCRRFR